MRRELTKVSLVLVLALSLPMGARAFAPQDPPPASDSAEQPEEKVEDQEPGKGGLSEFGDKLARFWSVNTAFQARQSFDDNVFLANGFRKSDSQTKLSGRMTVAYRGAHTRFEASYMPEFNLYQRYTPLNYSNHNYSHTLTHDFSRRLEMNWNASMYRAPSRGGLPFKLMNYGFFSFVRYAPEALADGLNLLHGQTSVGLSYRWTPRLVVKARAEGATTYFSVRGTRAVSPVTKEFIYSTGANVSLAYTLNASQSFGVTVDNTYFASMTPTRAIGSSGHHHYQSIRMTYSHKLPKKFTLNASAGPAVTVRPGGLDPLVRVHFDVGISRQLLRSSYYASFQRASQLGLLQDSFTGYGGRGGFHRVIGRKWWGGMGGSYMRSEGNSGLGDLESASGYAQISYRLTHRIQPFANYGYTHQKSLVASPTLGNVNRNEVAIGFTYNFGVIAGR